MGAGALNRDYPTLVRAMEGVDATLVVAAYSPWVSERQHGAPSNPSSVHVTVTQTGAMGLRELYARAALVAVPLVEGYSQAGSLVVYEAMAMGKPVVVTATEGQRALGAVRHGETGYLVAPGDVAGWREAVRYLLHHPEEAARMGRRARQVVEDGLNLDAYVHEMVDIVRATAVEGGLLKVA